MKKMIFYYIKQGILGGDVQTVISSFLEEKIDREKLEETGSNWGIWKKK